jgi:hypothetical protein
MYAFLAGTLQGQQQGVVKGFGLVLDHLGSDLEAVLCSWPIYFYLPTMIIFAVIVTHQINVGLAKFGALEFVPLQVTTMMIMGVLTGLFFDQEYKILLPVGWFMFSYGVVLISGGLKVLTMKPVAPEAQLVEKELDSRRGTEVSLSGERKQTQHYKDTFRHTVLVQFLSVVENSPLLSPTGLTKTRPPSRLTSKKRTTMENGSPCHEGNNSDSSPSGRGKNNVLSLPKGEELGQRESLEGEKNASFIDNASDKTCDYESDVFESNWPSDPVVSG